LKIQNRFVFLPKKTAKLRFDERGDAAGEKNVD
jgi:hypothetical protein